MTAVREVMDALSQSLYDTRLPQRRLAFLPSPVTVIDWHDPQFFGPDPRHKEEPPLAARDGVMLIESDDRLTAETYALGGPPHYGPHLTFVGKLRLRDAAALDGVAREDGRSAVAAQRDKDDWILYRHRQAGIYAALALINTPRIIGRRTRLPHAGLQRKLAAMHHMVGKYPLQAWHEVVLEVGPPKVDSREVEGRLTGARALHFCRAYLRVRNGMVEIVNAHWRGDPALGIKQTRYRLELPRC